MESLCCCAQYIVRRRRHCAQSFARLFFALCECGSDLAHDRRHAVELCLRWRWWRFWRSEGALALGFEISDAPSLRQAIGYRLEDFGWPRKKLASALTMLERI